MKRKYTITLDGKGVDEMLKGVQEYKIWLSKKTDELVQRLAERGATVASVNFAAAYYDGDNDVSVSTEQRGQNVCAVVATGEATLFIEFGSGLIGYGHPEPQGFGPGTYPGKGHWDDPDGWWYAHGKKSHGNPPAMAMYNTVKELEQDLEQIAREVFSA